MAYSVECPAPGFGSGHDLMVRGIEPHVRLCADSVEPAWDSLSLPVSLTLSHLCAHACAHALSRALSLSLSKETFKKNASFPRAPGWLSW